MPIGTGVPGEDFSARVIFKAPGIVPLFWAVTHEFSSNVGGTSDDDFATFAGSLAGFHQVLLNPAFLIDRVVVSTLAADSEPYDVTKLAVFEQNLPGARVQSGDILPLNNVVLVKRVVVGGRLGNMLLRGMLQEGDVASPGGVPGLSDMETMQTDVETAVTASGLGDYIGGSLSNLQLYMITKGLVDNTERPITGFRVAGITNKKLNNKYFDKGIL